MHHWLCFPLFQMLFEKTRIFVKSEYFWIWFSTGMIFPPDYISPLIWFPCHVQRVRLSRGLLTPIWIEMQCADDHLLPLHMHWWHFSGFMLRKSLFRFWIHIGIAGKLDGSKCLAKWWSWNVDCAANCIGTSQTIWEICLFGCYHKHQIVR